MQLRKVSEFPPGPAQEPNTRYHQKMDIDWDLCIEIHQSFIVVGIVSKASEKGVHIHVECIVKCWLLVFVSLVFVSAVILLIIFSTRHFDTASHCVAVAPYQFMILLVNGVGTETEREGLGTKGQGIEGMKEDLLVRTLSAAAVKGHIHRAAAKCTLAKIIILLACTLVYALIVLHRAGLADMVICCRIRDAVEFLAWYYVKIDPWREFWGATRESGEPGGPMPQLRSSK